MTKARDLGDNAQNTKPKVVDAKGDLIVGTGSDAADRLAAGSNGDTLLADSAATTGLRWSGNYAAGKNLIINGDFRINQRAFTSASGATVTSYGFDRWVNSGSGGTITYTAQTFTLGAAPVSGYEARNYLDIQTTGQTATNTTTRLDQRIESVRTLAGQTATVSFWAKAASGTPKIAVEFDQQFGTGGSPSSRVTTYAGQATLSTSWARYSVTVAVPSISGKTLGTAGDDFLALNLWVSAGTDFNARTGSLGIQTNTFSIWGVQAEVGSVATAFQTATGTLAGELAACQRYYYRHTASGVYTFFCNGNAYNTTIATTIFPLPVTMRTAPSALETSGTASHYRVVNGATSTACSAVPSFDQGGVNSIAINFTVASGLTAGQAINAGANNTTSAYLGVSAEL